MIRRLQPTETGQRGVSLVELVFVTAILVVLASLTLPVANTFVKREKELELFGDLWTSKHFRDRIQRFLEGKSS